MSVGKLFLQISQLHENQRLIQLGVTPGGRILVWLLATLMLPESKVFYVAPLLLVLLWLPDGGDGEVEIGQARVSVRNVVLCLGSVAYLARMLANRGISEAVFVAADVAILVVICLLVYRAACSFASWPTLLSRRPQLLLHGFLLGVLALSFTFAESPAITGSVLWKNVHVILSLLIFLVWRFGYLILAAKRGKIKQSFFTDHLFYFFPVWGGTVTPYGKGYDYLHNRSARSATAISASRLAGLKLLVLAWLWTQFRQSVIVVFYADAGESIGLLGLPGMGLPTLHTLIAAKEYASVPLAWISLFIEFIDSILRLAINGHLIIGTLRLFGYNVFRNTYKPLLAESLVEFWNRFYYYFKELLVEFFFFPTYVALSRRSQRFRIFAAVIAAACFGNIYYHVLRDIGFLAAVGLERSLGMIAPRVIYSFILALGISISMVREQQRRGHSREEPGRIRAQLRRVRRIGGVWLFYALLHVMVTGSIQIPLSYRLAFFTSLVGL